MTEAIDGEPGATDEDRAMADAVIDRIQRPRQSPLEDRGDPGGWLPKLDLPGFGDRGDDCGEEIPHFCDHCGHTFTVGRTCARSVCPRCAPEWVMKRAGSSKENSGGTKDDVETTEQPGHVALLDAAARMKSSASGGESIKWHHVVFSPPMNDWFLEAQDPLQRTFEVIREVLDLWGAEGYVYYHPWAGDNENHDGDDRDRWKNRLFNEQREWEGDVRDELIPRGHFHVVAAADWIPGGDVTRLVNEATGWVIKRITKRDGSGYSIDGLDDLAATVTYCLSHTGIDTSGESNRAAYRRYGSTFRAVQHCPKLEEADDWVRTVAPRTLGVAPKSVKCQEEVPEGEEQSHNDYTDLLEEGDGDGSATETADDPDEPDWTDCGGRVRSIDEAPAFLKDPEWRARARRSDELQSTWEEWENGDGWPGG